MNPCVYDVVCPCVNITLCRLRDLESTEYYFCSSIHTVKQHVRDRSQSMLSDERDTFEESSSYCEEVEIFITPSTDGTLTNQVNSVPNRVCC